MNIEAMAEREFKKLPKKKQREINQSRRIPVCRGSILFGRQKYAKKDRRWTAEEY